MNQHLWTTIHRTTFMDRHAGPPFMDYQSWINIHHSLSWNYIHKPTLLNQHFWTNIHRPSLHGPPFIDQIFQNSWTNLHGPPIHWPPIIIINEKLWTSIYESLFMDHLYRTPFIDHHSRTTSHGPPFMNYHSWTTIHEPPFMDHHSRTTSHGPLFMDLHTRPFMDR
jgi:hypothetical protein